jgi:hypothetical protein
MQLEMGVVNPKLWGDLEKAVVISAGRHYESILKALADSGTEYQSHKLSEEEDAKILVHTIFFECFMIRNELFGLVQDGEEANGVTESMLFRSLGRAFSRGGMTKLTLHGMEFIDHLAGAKDMVGSTLGSDCVAQRFLTTIDEILGVSKYSITNAILYSATSTHLLAGFEVYREIAKLLAA